MNTPNDGGPAFPCDWKDFQSCTGEQVVREQFPGMTLREWFAGMALQGMLSNSGIIDLHPAKHAAALSAEAYMVADAMIAQRKLEGK